MGLLDNLAGQVLGSLASSTRLPSRAAGCSMPSGPGQPAPGGLAGLIGAFERGGLGAVAASWVGTGPTCRSRRAAARSVLGSERGCSPSPPRSAARAAGLVSPGRAAAAGHRANSRPTGGCRRLVTWAVCWPGFATPWQPLRCCGPPGRWAAAPPVHRRAVAARVCTITFIFAKGLVRRAPRPIDGPSPPAAGHPRLPGRGPGENPTTGLVSSVYWGFLEGLAAADDARLAPRAGRARANGWPFQVVIAQVVRMYEQPVGRAVAGYSVGVTRPGVLRGWPT